MPLASPAAGARLPAALLLLTLTTTLLGLAVGCGRGEAAGPPARTAALEAALDAFATELRATLVDDLLRHLPEDGPWRAELCCDAAQLERVRAEHWDELIRPEGSGRYRVRADSFVEPIDEAPGRFADALPAIRVVDLLVLGNGQAGQPTVTIQTTGARLDERAARLLREHLDRAGFAVRVAGTAASPRR